MTNAANAEITRAWAINHELVSRLRLAIEAYNKLATQAQTYAADCNRRFDALEQRIAELERQNAELREAKAKADADIVEYAKERARRLFNGEE